MTSRASSTADRARGHASALPAQSRVGGCRLESVISQSECSFVYRAVDEDSGQVVAIKEYLPDALARRTAHRGVVPRARTTAAAFERGREAFLAEARFLAGFDHPSLLRVLQVFEAQGTAYRVMRFGPGPTLLAHRRALGQVPAPEDVQRWLGDLLGALGTLHAKGCTHGAVWPGNILMRPGEHTLLLDFGAVPRAIGGAALDRPDAVLARRFQAAEQRAAGPTADLGPWTDLYGLAGSLHYALTARLPDAPGQAGFADALARWREAPDSPPLPDPLARLCAVLTTALCDAPASRPHSVAEFRDWLDGGGLPMRPAAAPERAALAGPERQASEAATGAPPRALDPGHGRDPASVEANGRPAPGPTDRGTGGSAEEAGRPADAAWNARAAVAEARPGRGVSPGSRRPDDIAAAAPTASDAAAALSLEAGPGLGSGLVPETDVRTDARKAVPSAGDPALASQAEATASVAAESASEPTPEPEAAAGREPQPGPEQEPAATSTPAVEAGSSAAVYAPGDALVDVRRPSLGVTSALEAREIEWPAWALPGTAASTHSGADRFHATSIRIAAGVAVLALLLWHLLDTPGPGQPSPPVRSEGVNTTVHEALAVAPPRPLADHAQAPEATLGAPLVTAVRRPDAAKVLLPDGAPSEPPADADKAASGVAIDGFERLLQAQPTGAGPEPPVPTDSTSPPSRGEQWAQGPVLPPASRRPAKAAPPAPAATAPRQVCAGRTGFALYECMHLQCALASWSSHDQCVELHHSDRVRVR